MRSSFFSEVKESNLSKYGNTALKSIDRSQPKRNYPDSSLRYKT